MTALTALRPHALLTQALSFLLVLSTAYTLWKGLSVLSDCKSPIVVVLSGSMEPAFRRGDLLFLWNRDGLLPKCPSCEFLAFFYPPDGGDGRFAEWGMVRRTDADGGRTPAVGRVHAAEEAWAEGKDVRVAEVVVYEVRGKDIPIVHRVVRRFPKGAGGGAPSSIALLTKGDNNAADDVELYARGQSYLDRDRDVIGSVVGYVPFVGYGTILLSEYPWLKTVMLGLMGVTVVLQRD